MRNVNDTMTLAKYLGTNQDKHIVISGSSFVGWSALHINLNKNSKQNTPTLTQ